jgi:hypothetical protein
MGSGRSGVGLLGVVAALATACSAPVPPPPDAVSPPGAVSPPSTADAVAGPAGPAATGCATDVAPAPLPGWARSGFTPPDQAVPYVVGEGGTILGVLFGQPLSAPPAPDRGNKILWITRDTHPAGPLTITAALDGTTTVASREIPDGPGPSLVDLPTPGCWRLTLAWPGHTDRVTVAYR